MNLSTKHLWPVAAIITGIVGAWAIQPPSSLPAGAYSASVAAPTPSDELGNAPRSHGRLNEEAAGERLQGKVVETISVPNYTYLRLLPMDTRQRDGTNELWAAVATADVKIGDLVTVVGAQRMDKFTSNTLKRTFDAIYFGALEGGTEASATTLPKGHPELAASPGAASSEPPAASPHGAMGAMLGEPHGSPTAGGDQVPVGKVERAQGAMGHTVAEVVNDRSKLVGKKIRVRGVVVKATSGVLGRTFLHLRDGSGSATAGDHDLTVTTEQEARVGSTMLFEGSVVTDKDFGAGYSYRVLLENARSVGD